MNILFYLKLLLLFLFILVSSCSFQRPKNMVSPLSYLHGKHYEAGPVSINNMNIPLGFKKNTIISGKLVFHHKGQSIPLPFKKMKMIHLKSGEVFEIMTDENGHFNFADDIYHGNYQFILEDSHYELKKDVVIDQYETFHLELSCQLKADS